jgi:uncharacterized protein (TIGR03435 family)
MQIKYRLSLAVLTIASGLPAQAPMKRPAFDVSSVKENPGSPYQDDVPQRSGDRVTMRCARLNAMIAWAWRLANPNYEIVTGPYEKLFSDMYDIAALTHDGVSDDNLRLMFQNLLEERFALKVHREKREMSAYDLVTEKGGAKLTPASPRPMKNSVAVGGISSWIEILGHGTQQVTGRGASMDELAIVLTRRMKAPVVNKTAISGEFDYAVRFSSGVDESDAPVLTTAIHELGLNLEKTSGAFDVLVIDHLAKPSAN